MNSRFTVFVGEPGQFHALLPVALAAVSRGYPVTFADDVTEPADIGLFAGLAPEGKNCRFSVVMLHDMGQQQWPQNPSAEPNLWIDDPWEEFDLGVLPGPAWADCWTSVSWQSGARPRLGVFVGGWPKSDRAFQRTSSFITKVNDLRRSLQLEDRRTVLYAPSWENDGKQDDVVTSLIDLPINLLIKQPYWPTEDSALQATTDRHLALSSRVHALDPRLEIMYALALADLVISDESNCLVEGLIFDSPGIAVSDWQIPPIFHWPSRAVQPPPHAILTTRDQLRDSVQNTLRDRASLKPSLRRARDEYFAHQGVSADLILDVIEAASTGATWPVERLQPLPLRTFETTNSGPVPRAAVGSPVQPLTPRIQDFGPKLVDDSVRSRAAVSGWVSGVLATAIEDGAPASWVRDLSRVNLWLLAHDVSPSTVAVIDGRPLPSAVDIDRGVVTTIAPVALLESAGSRSLQLLNTETGALSDSVALQVTA